MIITKKVDNSTGCKTMAKRRNVKGTFGWRIRDERESKEFTQEDMITIMNADSTHLPVKI